MPAYKKISPSTGRASWYVSFYYTDWTGKKKQKKKEGFDTRKAALDFERGFLERQAASPDMTFAALCDLYLADYKVRYRITSYAARDFELSSYVRPFFADMPINAITPATVRQWQAEIKERKSKRDGKPLSPAMLGSIHKSFSAVLNYAVKYYKLPSNPARLSGSMGARKSPEMHFWTIEQFKAFQKTIESDDLHAVAFALLFYTGVRKGELLALTPADFNLKAGLLTISKSYTRLQRKDLIQPPKTEKGYRKIALPPFIVDMMKDCFRRLHNPAKNQRIFDAISETTLRHTLNAGAEAAGLPHIRVHDLRHSHASLLIEQGFSPLVIKERLGHENIETTLNTYSHLYPTKQSEIAEKLQAISGHTKRKRRKITSHFRRIISLRFYYVFKNKKSTYP